MSSAPTTASSPLVLVTGGSSFVGLHVIHQAVQQKYRVRTTIRTAAKKQLILDALTEYDGTLDYGNVEFVEADLMYDEGWNEAARDAQYILHIASPVPLEEPMDEDELIRPAREGTLRVLRAAKASGTCKRVVVTSSVAAIYYGKTKPGGSEGLFTDADWTDTNDPTVNAYGKSKTLAERAAWAFVEKGAEGEGLELCTVNPVATFGPQIRPEDPSISCQVVRKILTGAIPVAPRVSMGVVDVRDVASLHFLAMTKPKAVGQRLIAVADEKLHSLLEMSRELKKHLGDKAAKAPTREIPDWVIRLGALFSVQLKMTAMWLGKKHAFDNTRALALGWKTRSAEEAIVATAQRMIDKGMV